MATDVIIGIKTEFDKGAARKAEAEAKQSANNISKGVTDAFKTAAAAGGAAIIAQGAFEFGEESVNLAREQAKAVAQLDAAIASTGNSSGLTSEQLQAMASELQNVTNFGDEATIASQAMLLTFTQIGEETFPRAQMAILDLATAMGKSLPEATQQVGKALNDPITGVSALAESGIQFTEVQKEMIASMVETGDVAGAQALILAELETQFGGSAEAAREADGGFIALGNAVGDAQEELGFLLLQIADTAGGAEGLIGIVVDLTERIKSWQFIMAVLSDTTVITNENVRALVDGAKLLIDALVKITSLGGFAALGSDSAAGRGLREVGEFLGIGGGGGTSTQSPASVDPLSFRAAPEDIRPSFPAPAGRGGGASPTIINVNMNGSTIGVDDLDTNINRAVQSGIDQLNAFTTGPS